MKNLIIGLLFLVSPFLSFGHNPLSARYHLDAGEQASLLTINLSQDGVNQALLQTHDQQELEGLDQKQFKELIVDYVKHNFSLSVNEQEIVLQKGGIKLGSHQTDLKFVLPAFTEQIENLDIHIPAFNENDNHQTIFSYNIAGRNEHVILSLNNDYQSAIIFRASILENKYLWAISFSVISLIVIILLKVALNNKGLNYTKKRIKIINNKSRFSNSW